jgi:hypothetical protein
VRELLRVALHNDSRRAGASCSPRNGTCDGGLEVLGEPAASVEPGEGSLDHPSTRQNLEAFGLSCSWTALSDSFESRTSRRTLNTDATGIASRKSTSDKPTPETVPQSLSSKLSKTLPSNSSSICRSFLPIFDR